MKKSRSDLKRIILSTVAVAGLLGVAVVAPNAIGAMVKLGLIPSKRQKEIINTARARLVKQELLVYKSGFARLTPKGEAVLRKLKLQEYKIKKPKRWDKKWRVLIFDIPEKRRKTRVQVRTTLQRIGFIRLQDSVWVYPYECEELAVLIKADLKVGKDILYMVVEKLEGDAWLKNHFNLTH